MLIGNSKGSLFEPSVTLNCYPLEFIFAEKLETVVHRGEENSRMKDFHDLYTLCTEGKLQKEPTKNAVSAVFVHRKTPLKLPIRFNKSALDALQSHWHRYYRSSLAIDILPLEIDRLLATVNQLLI